MTTKQQPWNPESKQNKKTRNIKKTTTPNQQTNTL